MAMQQVLARCCWQVTDLTPNLLQIKQRFQGKWAVLEKKPEVMAQYPQEWNRAALAYQVRGLVSDLRHAGCYGSSLLEAHPIVVKFAHDV